MPRFSLTAAAIVLCLTPSFAQDTTHTARNGAVDLAYWLQGPENGTPIMLLNGQGAATRTGNEALVDALVAEGFRVVIFDNRDSGQSTILRDAGAPPDTENILAALSVGADPAVAYDLSDMADDAVAVLAAAGIDRAHFLGHSLGGMIAQMVAIEHPDRVLSLISMSATSGQPDLPYGPALTTLSDPTTFASLDVVQGQIKAYRIFEGDASHRMTEDEVAARVAADMIADDPNAAARQAAAATASGDRRPLLAEVTQPALVIHGGDDPWFAIDHAESTAAALGAKVEIIEGMGHIVADAAAQAVVGKVTKFIRDLPPQ